MHIDTNGPMRARISKNIWNISFLIEEPFLFSSSVNQYSIDWSKVIDKKDLSKSHPFFLSKFFFWVQVSSRFA
jgi:hypothetical protein